MEETATARTLVFDVPGWRGHLAGQHVDVKLTAEDGYSAQRSYSIASAPGGARLELTVQRIADGEVSPYLTEVLEPGDPIQLRGPIGGWFVWNPDHPPSRGVEGGSPPLGQAEPAPLLLVAGGSGIVPLMAMIRAHAANRSKVPLRLIYSVRTPADAIYASELSERSVASPLEVTYLYTRAAPAAVVAPDAAAAPATVVAPDAAAAPATVAAPDAAAAPATVVAADAAAARTPSSAAPGGAGPGEGAGATRVHAGRISAEVIAASAWPPEAKPAVFICGPTGFVETAAELLVAAGHAPAAVKTERFGPTGQP